VNPLQSLPTALAVLACFGQAQAASEDFSDYSELLATTWAISGFAAACPREADTGTAAAYGRWRAENYIDEIESHVDGILMQNDEFAMHYRSSKEIVDAKVAELVPEHCAQLPQLLTQETYRPAIAQKRQVEAILRDVGQAGSAGEPPQRQSAAAPADDVIKQDAARIAAVVFDTRMRMGAGGVLWPEPSPVLLLQDGETCTDMRALAFPGGLDAHKQQHPKSWTLWRRGADGYELKRPDGWKAVAYKTEYGPLAAETRLDRAFRRLGGGGTAAIGGADSVAVAAFYRFAADGRFTREQAAGSLAETSGNSVATLYSSPDLAGRYQIDGYLLTLTYGNGAIEHKAIAFDPQNPSAIWLNGYGYTD